MQKKNDHLMDARDTSCVPGATWRAASLRTNRRISCTELAGGWAERAGSGQESQPRRREPGNAAEHSIRVLEVRSVFVPESKRKAGLGNALI